MEYWKRQELDMLTCGEVALRVFGAEQELEEAANARAEACRKLAAARDVLDAANEVVKSAAREEQYCSDEYKALKKYLNERLHKVESNG